MGDNSNTNKVEAPQFAPKTDEKAAAPTKKKNKGGKKTLAKRGPTALPDNRGSGFEEYFADPPLTLQEAEEERENIYSPDLPFEERIQSCIQRFRSRRRLHEAKRRYFDEYLFLGGIDTNPTPFTGQDPGELKKMTPTKRRNATAHDGIHTHLDTEESRNNRFFTGDLENWAVDFAGVAAGFFSLSLGPLTGFEPQAMEEAIDVIDNFLRYTLQHDVCPEYADDIQQALTICQDARGEWPLILQAQDIMPGVFNLAASLHYKVFCKDDWSLHLDLQTLDSPNTVFALSLALLRDSKLLSGLKNNTKIIREFDCTVEIVNISRPTSDIVKSLKALRVDGEPVRFTPPGKIKVKPAVIEDDWEPANINQPFSKGFMTLYFNDNILAMLKPGMKMSIRVCQLDIDLKFVKTLHQLVPTFYTFLPQDMMRYFKPPRESERPAPSIHDRPDGEGDGQQDGVKENDEVKQPKAGNGAAANGKLDEHT